MVIGDITHVLKTDGHLVPFCGLFIFNVVSLSHKISALIKQA